MRDLLLSIFDTTWVSLHNLSLVQLELDLALVLQLRQNHESLVIVSIIEEVGKGVDLLLRLNGAVKLVDLQSVLHMLLGTVTHLLQ